MSKRGASPRPTFLYFCSSQAVLLLTFLGLIIYLGFGTSSSSVSVISTKGVDNLRKGGRFPFSSKATTMSMIGAGASAALRGSLKAAVPPMLYGTAWKKGETARLVEMAVRKGFRGIDTACQPKHYNERGVGEALDRLYAAGFVARQDLFLQTKFTSVNGQDPNDIPYDKEAPLSDQVRQSLLASLSNLRTTYLDSLVLHSPMKTLEQTMAVWRVFEEFVGEKQVVFLGISNCYDASLLRQIYAQSTIKPTFLQNRFHRATGYDVEIREFCREVGIKYQSFWTLTANPDIVKVRAAPSHLPILTCMPLYTR